MVSDSAALDAVLLLSRSAASARAALDTTLSRVGLWLGDLSLLAVFADGPLDRAGIAAALEVSQSEALRRLKQMEKLNWLERDADSRFALTGNGRALLSEASGLAANRSEVWLEQRLSSHEIAVLTGLLTRIIA